MRPLQVPYAAQISFLKENRITPEITPCGSKLNWIRYVSTVFLHMQAKRLLSRCTGWDIFAASDKFLYLPYFFRTMDL